jgi:hypothetical protein
LVACGSSNEFLQMAGRVMARRPYQEAVILFLLAMGYVKKSADPSIYGGVLELMKDYIGNSGPLLVSFARVALEVDIE